MPNFATGSSLTIEETAPAGAGFKPRILVLLGPALPFMGAEWGFENNVITSWYPGNSIEATQQNLGPREMPSQWEGEWKRTLMGRVPSVYTDEGGQQHKIVSPHVMREVFEDIARAGVRLRVTWSVKGTMGVSLGFSNPSPTDIDVSIVREGLVKSFKTPIDRHTDMKWQVQFDWASRGGRQDKVASVRQDEDLNTASAALDASVNILLAASISKAIANDPLIRKSASHFTLGQLEALANAPLLALNNFERNVTQQLNSIKRVGDVARKVSSLTSDTGPLASSIKTFAHNTQTLVHQAVQGQDRTPVELMTTKSRPASVVRASKFFFQNNDAAVSVARTAQELEAKMRRAITAGANQGEVAIRDSSTTRAGDIIGIHVCKTGDTPQSVSMRYYGDADHGPNILKANRLPLYLPVFDRGQILVIPALVNAPSAKAS